MCFLAPSFVDISYYIYKTYTLYIILCRWVQYCTQAPLLAESLYMFSRVFRIYHYILLGYRTPNMTVGAIWTCVWIIRSRHIRFVCHLCGYYLRSIRSAGASASTSINPVPCVFFIQFLCACSITRLPFLPHIYNNI